jgi:hypothetical protein
MKKRQILFLLLCSFQYTFCQPTPPHAKPVRLPDTAYIYRTDGTVSGFLHYLYDDRGQRCEIRYFNETAGNWDEVQQRHYTYDGQGNLLSDLLLARKDGSWKNLKRNSYAYDTAGNRTLEQYQAWSDSLNRWYTEHSYHYTYNRHGTVDTFWREDNDSEYISRIFYSHDTSGNVTLEQWQIWDTAWTDIFRAISTYDSASRLADYVEQNWNHTHGGPPKLEWENWLHYVYRYDANGNNSELQTWVWNCGDEEWINEKHFHYTYDSAHRKMSEMFYAWSRASSQWVKKEFLQNEYDCKGRLTNSLLQTPYNKEWINHRLRKYSYDDEDRMLSRTEAYWNIGDGEWENNNRNVWDYDADGHLTGETGYFWDSHKNEWYGNYRTLTSFDEEGDGDTCSYEMYNSRKGWYPYEYELFVPYLNNTEKLGAFSISKVSVHYRMYEDTSHDAVAQYPESTLRCYPNPTQDFIRIRTEGEPLLHCQLWDANGRLLTELHPCREEVTLPMQQLPKGIYLLRCRTSKETISRIIYRQ